MKEIREMMYQWRVDYLVDSSEFMEKFPEFKPTPLDVAVKETVDAFVSMKKN